MTRWRSGRLLRVALPGCVLGTFLGSTAHIPREGPPPPASAFSDSSTSRKGVPLPVHFAESAARTASADDLTTAIRRVLGDRAATGGPAARVRACLCAGFARPGCTSADVRRTILSVAAPASAVARIAGSRAWGKHVREAAALCEQNARNDPLAVTARMLPIARCLVARLLSELPARPVAVAAGKRDVNAGRATQIGDPIIVRKKSLSPRAEATARIVLAAVGAKILSDRENGWDSALLSADYLGLLLNIDHRTATRAAKACVKLGWMTRATSSRGIPRYRLTRLRGPEAEVADDFDDTVNALATGRSSDDPIAEMLMALINDHTFAYTQRWAGVRGWLAAISALACAPAMVVGLTERDATRLRKEITATFAELDLPGIGLAPLVSQLPTVAEHTLADFVWADTVKTFEAKRAEVAAERQVYAERRRRERAFESQLEEQVFQPARKLAQLPKGDWSNEAIREYVSQTIDWWRAVASQLPTDAAAAKVRHQLEYKLRYRRMDEARAKQIAETLIPAPAETESVAA
jgi:hypothetical protein